jgi:superfamily I DNA/RNA helicase
MNDVQILLGPPGTGKTTRCLQLVERELESGIDPHRVGFVSFTTKAANEAKERACRRFRLKPEDFPYFKTIHALAFSYLSMSSQNVMNRKHYRELFDYLGIEYAGRSIDDDDLTRATQATMGDKILFIQNLSRAKMSTLKEEWELSDFNEQVSWLELERFQIALEQYKENKGLFDFNDMLLLMIDSRSHPKFDVLFIDEAQDLSKLQWKAIEKVIADCPKVYIAGDDDQAIFRWAGADVDFFIGLQGNSTVLGKSYRLRANVHSVCSNIISQVSNRREKQFTPREEGGSVEFYNSVDDLDMSSGSWLLLARNSFMLPTFENHCTTSGFSYSGRTSPLESDELKAVRAYEHWRKGNEISDQDYRLVRKFSDSIPDKPTKIWHEQFTRMNYRLKEYFISALRIGESLTKEPRIRVSTIHGAKGAEADNVVIMSDISNRCFETLNSSPDDELRVAYVAASRARENLFIILPKTSIFFDYASF